jgi:hypothetical protein
MFIDENTAVRIASNLPERISDSCVSAAAAPRSGGGAWLAIGADVGAGAGGSSRGTAGDTAGAGSGVDRLRVPNVTILSST